MASTLDQYRQAKTDYLKLRNQAKKELIARFNELSTELFQLQRELLEDFGEKIAIPTKPRKGRAVAKKKAVAETPAAPAVPSAEVVALRKRLDAQKKKLAEQQAAGKPTKAMEDRVYEIEDAIRLAQSK